MLNFSLVAENNFRQKRNAKNVNKKSNVSEIVSREYIKREVRLAINNLACVVHCPKGVRGRRGRPGPPGKHGPAGPQGPQKIRIVPFARNLYFVTMPYFVTLRN